jgi:predicted transcriptional regulator
MKVVGLQKRLGAKQMQILKVIWRREEATAREITDDLNAGQDTLTAHSTVQTLLRELEQKKVVDHRLEGRTFIFFATIAEGEVAVSATQDLMRRVFEGSPLRLMTHLLQHEKLSPGDLERLHRLIEERNAEIAREKE